MLFNNKIIKFVTTVVCIPLFSTITYAQSESPGWTEILNFQLLVDYECEVVEYESMYEGKLGGRNTYVARAVCKDGRRYDANRIGETDDFVIRICEIVRC